jgi:hypothetical protein
VLVEPVSGTEARSALQIVADSLLGLADAEGVDLIVDCGSLETAERISPTPDAGARTTASPIARLLMHADVVLVVSFGELADLSHVHTVLPSLRSRNSDVSVVVRSPQVWNNEEIERELDVQVAGSLPFDVVSADVLAGRHYSRRAARLPLFRAARATAERVVDHLDSVSGDVANKAAAGSGAPSHLTPEVAVP